MNLMQGSDQLPERFIRINFEVIYELLILDLGGEYLKKESQSDTYFNHPSRDFANTDEALRIRKTKDKSYLTYKGPKIDNITKTREEIEVAISNFEETEKILKRLGFIEVLTIKKVREFFNIKDFSIMLDKVANLGDFIEIEKHSNAYEPREMVSFLKKLGVEEKDIEGRSYLELMLVKL
jgi:adenylate cyclase class 2